MINHTRFGLNVRAVGENPEAADSRGVSVNRTRTVTILVANTLAGVAGAALALEIGTFQQNLTNGIGFIAVALVYFGSWRPLWVFAGSFLYGLLNATVNQLKTLGIVSGERRQPGHRSPGRAHDRRPRRHRPSPRRATGGTDTAVRPRRLDLSINQHNPQEEPCKRSKSERHGALRRTAIGGESRARRHGRHRRGIGVRRRRTPTTSTVAVVMPSAANDLAFSQSMIDSLERLAEADVIDEYDYSENMFVVEDAAAAIRDYAESGDYDFVIAHGSQYGGPLAEIAPDFPDVAFAWGTESDTFGLPNVSAYTASSDQGGYVMGDDGGDAGRRRVRSGSSDRSRWVTPSCTSTGSSPGRRRPTPTSRSASTTPSRSATRRWPRRRRPRSSTVGRRCSAGRRR